MTAVTSRGSCTFPPSATFPWISSVLFPFFTESFLPFFSGCLGVRDPSIRSFLGCALSFARCVLHSFPEMISVSLARTLDVRFRLTELVGESVPEVVSRPCSRPGRFLSSLCFFHRRRRSVFRSPLSPCRSVFPNYLKSPPSPLLCFFCPAGRASTGVKMR